MLAGHPRYARRYDGGGLAAAEVLALTGGVVNAWLFLTR